MGDITIRLEPDVRLQLEALAERLDRPLDDCLKIAVEEFISNWEMLASLDDVMDVCAERPLLAVGADALKG